MLPPESQLPPPPVACKPTASVAEPEAEQEAAQLADASDSHAGQGLAAQGAQIELKVTCPSSPEAFRLMLDYVYVSGLGLGWEYRPSCAEVNRDVIRLAAAFDLRFLHEQAVRWLVKDLSTSNVLERLVTCNEFDLSGLRAKIIQHLIQDADKLQAVSEGAEIVKHPQVLQDILLSVARHGEEMSSLSAFQDQDSSPEHSTGGDEADKEGDKENTESVAKGKREQTNPSKRPFKKAKVKA